MKRIRVILQSTENGEKESVIFTDDFDSAAEDFLVYGRSVDSDSLIPDCLPSGFPLNYTLERE